MSKIFTYNLLIEDVNLIIDYSKETYLLFLCKKGFITREQYDTLVHSTAVVAVKKNMFGKVLEKMFIKEGDTDSDLRFKVIEFEREDIPKPPVLETPNISLVKDDVE